MLPVPGDSTSFVVSLAPAADQLLPVLYSFHVTCVSLQSARRSRQIVPPIVLLLAASVRSSDAPVITVPAGMSDTSNSNSTRNGGPALPTGRSAPLRFVASLICTSSTVAPHFALPHPVAPS